MKRMTECRGDDLRKFRTQGAGLICCGPIRLDLQPDMVRIGEVAQFVNNGTVLSHHQQQQEA